MSIWNNYLGSNYQNYQNQNLSGQKRNTTNNTTDDEAGLQPAQKKQQLSRAADDDDDDDDEMDEDDENQTYTTPAPQNTSTVSSLTYDAHAQALQHSLASSTTTAQQPSLEKFLGGAEAGKIHNFSNNKNYEKMPSYQEHMKTNPDKPFHIHGSQVPPDLGGPLKCSLVIVPNGPIMVLLKGKAAPGTGASLRAHGDYKTVKPAFNQNEKKLCANCGYDVQAEKTRRLGVFAPNSGASRAALLLGVHSWAGKRGDVLRRVLGPNAPATKEEILQHFEKLDDAAIKELMGKVIEECVRQDVDNEFEMQGASDLPGTYKTEYKSSVTREEQEDTRSEEGKLIRHEPHTLVCFFVPLAEGAMSDEKVREGIVNNPQRFQSCVEDMGTGLLRLHNKGIAHLDIKFGNLLVVDGHAVWSDFGCAQKVNAQNARFRGSKAIADPVTYAASLSNPDQATKDFRNADVYSLGLAYYKLLTGQETSYQRLARESNPDEGSMSMSTIEEEITSQLEQNGTVDWNEIDTMEKEVLEEQAAQIQSNIDAALNPENDGTKSYEEEIRANLTNVGCPQPFADLLVNMLKIDSEGAKNRPTMQEVDGTIKSMREQNVALRSPVGAGQQTEGVQEEGEDEGYIPG